MSWVGSRAPLFYKILPIFVHLWKHSLQLALFELEPCFFPLSKPQPIPSFHQLLMRRCLLLLFHWLLKKNKCEFVFCTQVLFDSIITIDSFDIVFREKRSILRHCIYIYIPKVKRNIFSINGTLTWHKYLVFSPSNWNSGWNGSWIRILLRQK